MVRVTYYTKRDGDNLVPLHSIWDYDAYMAAHSLYDKAFAELRQE